MIGQSQAGAIDQLRSGKVVTPSPNGEDELPSAATLLVDGRIVIVGEAGQAHGTFVAVYTPDGELDATFAGDGRDWYESGAFYDRAFAVAQQDDGRIIVGGETPLEAFLLRLNVDGTLDVSFGEGGRVVTDTGGIYQNSLYWRVEVQPDGKILANGGINGTECIVRYTVDGRLDLSFGNSGIADLSVLGGGMMLGVQSDGRIIVAGNDRVFRLEADGALETSFGDGGDAVFLGNLIKAAIEPDGRILVLADSASGIAWARFGADGADAGNSSYVVPRTLPSSFRIGDMFLDSQDRLIVSGTSITGTGESDYVTIRFRGDGSLDSSFGNAGIVHTDFGIGNDQLADAILQPDGRIVLVGHSYDQVGEVALTIARYNPDG